MPSPLEEEDGEENLPGKNVEEEESDEGAIEKDERKRADLHQQFKREGVVAASGDTVAAHLMPSGERLLGFALHERIVLEDHSGVGGRSVLIDKHIVGTVGDTVVLDKGTVFEEELAAVGEIAAGAGEGVVHESGAKIRDRINYIIILLESAEETGLVFDAAVAENDAGGGVVVATDHLADPREIVKVVRHTIGVGEEEDVVFGRLDADGERVLLALEEIDVFAEGDDFEAAVVFGEELEDVFGVVVGDIVDNDDLKVGVVLLEEIDKVFAEPVAVVVGGEDHGDGRQHLVGFGWRELALSAAHAEIEQTVIESGEYKPEQKERNEQLCQ